MELPIQTTLLTASDVLKGIGRYHLCPVPGTEDSTMSADALGDWVWFEEAVDFLQTQEVYSLPRYTLFSPAELDAMDLDHAGTRQAHMIQCQDGVWVEEKALRELAKEQNKVAQAAAQPPTWAEVREALESLLGLVEPAPSGANRSSSNPINQARALLGRLPTQG